LLACESTRKAHFLIDFYGNTAVLEFAARWKKDVWSDPTVLARLKNDYRMVALYI